MIIVRKSYAAPEPNMREVYRYMGVSGEPDSATAALAENAVDEIRRSASCRVCFGRTPIIRDGGKLIIGTIVTDSVFLARNLDGCDEVFLFFATIGGAADRLIASSRLAPSRALALDASASALTEALCNILNAELKAQAAAENRFLRPRYSAGFGDFTLKYQKNFTEMLNTPKNIGVVLRNGAMLYPTKSVSALIGISDRERRQ